MKVSCVISACVATLHCRRAFRRTLKFYPDDPIWADDDAVVDASKALEQEDSNGYDFVVNTFGDKVSGATFAP